MSWKLRVLSSASFCCCTTLELKAALAAHDTVCEPKRKSSCVTALLQGGRRSIESQFDHTAPHGGHSSAARLCHARRLADAPWNAQVAEYMKAGAQKACDVFETRFFSDGREYVAGPEFTAAGA